MLSYKEARKIGNNACINMLGKDFCLAHQDNGTSGYDIEPHDGKMECFVCISDQPDIVTLKEYMQREHETPFPFRCIVNVDMKTGEVEYVEYITPDGRFFPKSQ